MYVCDSVLVIMMCILHNVYHNRIPLCIYLVHSTLMIKMLQHLVKNDTLTLVVTVGSRADIQHNEIHNPRTRVPSRVCKV